MGYDDRKKMLWAAVGENDVNAWDGKKWKVYMSIESGITSILCDTQSRIWFGSETGLIKFNGEEWITQAEKIGVSMAQVTNMYRDSAGNMWFASDQGVMKLLNPYPY
jgi:ligand-binding sensor domain-containing protein